MKTQIIDKVRKLEFQNRNQALQSKFWDFNNLRLFDHFHSNSKHCCGFSFTMYLFCSNALTLKCSKITRYFEFEMGNLEFKTLRLESTCNRWKLKSWNKYEISRFHVNTPRLTIQFACSKTYVGLIFVNQKSFVVLFYCIEMVLPFLAHKNEFETKKFNCC